MKQFSLKAYLAIALGLIIVTAIALLAMDRLPWCECGYIKIWHGIVYSSENSQHLFDWYTFTHILHGLVFYFLIWIFTRNKQYPFGLKLLMAVFLACAWEVVENSPFIIDRYRAGTISLDYYGDSVINSIGDILAASAGFIFAAKTRWWASAALFIIIECALLYVIRDNLTLNVIMLIYPIDAIKQWQALGNAIAH